MLKEPIHVIGLLFDPARLVLYRSPSMPARRCQISLPMLVDGWEEKVHHILGLAHLKGF